MTMKKKHSALSALIIAISLISSQNIVNAESIKVNKGDTLWSISKKYKASVNELLKLNNLKSQTIYIGQILNLPTKGSSNSSITKVQKQVNTSIGDPLNVRTGPSISYRSIGKLTHKTLVTVQKTSGKWSYVESKGVKGYVSSKYLVTPKPTNETITPIDQEEVSKKTIYTVLKGDTLYVIAQKFNTTYQKIAKLNDLNSYVIYSGQKLTVSETTIVTETPKKELPVLPTPELTINKPLIYTVKAGDTLYGISNKNNVSVNLIKKYNNLTTNIIHIGQNLKLSQSIFINPTDGVLTSGYGTRIHPITREHSNHVGIDIAKKGIVPILAVYDGKVTRSEYSHSFGNVVYIQHDINGFKYETVYAHMRNREVKLGELVTQGQQLGLMGSTGDSTGQHLHFEVHNGKRVGEKNSLDPLLFVY
jgi:LysM repeat protein